MSHFEILYKIDTKEKIKISENRNKIAVYFILHEK